MGPNCKKCIQISPTGSSMEMLSPRQAQHGNPISLLAISFLAKLSLDVLHLSSPSRAGLEFWVCCRAKLSQPSSIILDWGSSRSSQLGTLWNRHQQCVLWNQSAIYMQYHAFHHNVSIWFWTFIFIIKIRSYKSSSKVWWEHTFLFLPIIPIVEVHINVYIGR